MLAQFRHASISPQATIQTVRFEATSHHNLKGSHRLTRGLQYERQSDPKWTKQSAAVETTLHHHFILLAPGHEGLHRALPPPSRAIRKPSYEPHVSHAPGRSLPSETPGGPYYPRAQ